MVATFVLVVGMLGVVAMVDVANRNTVETRGREAATSLARQLVEDVRAIPFGQLSPNAIRADLQRQPGLESIPGSSVYTIRRRGFTYSVDTSVCTLDDPRDGIGSHANGSFCAGGASGLGDCQGAVAAAGSAGVDANGNTLSASLCASVDAALAWRACDTLGTTAAAQASGSLSVVLGSLYGSADAAARATACESGSAVPADLDPEDYKRVVVAVRWGDRHVQQTALVANPGSSTGPAVTSLELDESAGSLTVTGDAPALRFSATTNRAPATVDWTLDGHRRGTATGSGTSWSFAWEVGSPGASGAVVDGTYIVGARALDSAGLAGAGRTLTVTLNRAAPRAPGGLVGGRNGQVVELEWSPNPERDVVGYRVYRSLTPGGAAERVCPASGDYVTRTACQDVDSPPGGTLHYHVVALDRDPSGALRAGDRSAERAVLDVNRPPNPPTDLEASSDAGDTILRWEAAAVPDPDPGDEVQFFRVYRDGRLYADRYDRTATGGDLVYADTRTGGTQHSYYVTAVDSQLAESPIVGPVTR